MKVKVRLYTVSSPNIHKKLKTLSLDRSRGILYSADDVAKVIVAYDLNARKCVGHIKCSNANPNRILIYNKDSNKYRRMYVTTKQGLLLFFDIANVYQPVLIYSMKVVLRPDSGINFVKQINMDTDRNILVLGLKNSDVLVIQLIIGKEHMSTIVEKIPF